MAKVDAISFIPSESWANEVQPESLEGDVFVEEVEWAALAEAEAAIESLKMMGFDKPYERMTKYLKSLYIKACINGKTISRVIIDGDVTFILFLFFCHYSVLFEYYAI